MTASQLKTLIQVLESVMVQDAVKAQIVVSVKDVVREMIAAIVKTVVMDQIVRSQKFGYLL